MKLLFYVPEFNVLKLLFRLTCLEVYLQDYVLLAFPLISKNSLKLLAVVFGFN